MGPCNTKSTNSINASTTRSETRDGQVHLPLTEGTAAAKPSLFRLVLLALLSLRHHIRHRWIQECYRRIWCDWWLQKQRGRGWAKRRPEKNNPEFLILTWVAGQYSYPHCLNVCWRTRTALEQSSVLGPSPFYRSHSEHLGSAAHSPGFCAATVEISLSREYSVQWVHLMVLNNLEYPRRHWRDEGTFLKAMKWHHLYSWVGLDHN